jgi:two-component system sensor histidine kinase AgrC
MDYIKIFIVVLMNYGVSIGCHIYLCGKAWGNKWSRKEFITGFGILYTLFCLPYMIGIEGADFIAYILQIAGLAGFMNHYHKKTLSKCIGISGAAFIFVYMFIKSFFITSSQTLFQQLSIEASFDWKNFVYSLIEDGALLLCVFLICKKGISTCFSKLYRNKNRFATVIICFYITVWLIVSEMISVKGIQTSQGYEKVYFLMLVTFIGGMILLLFLLTIYYRNERKNEKIKMQESMLMQQKMYIQTLENLQREIKKFQHDYKNIVAGLYVSDKKSDTLQYLEKNILCFEENLSCSLQETASLSHIKLEEVKGLILAKMLQAKEKGVAFSLEVIKDVEDVFMDVVDFNRCLGILIDNGMEAAGKCEKKEVYVIMIQERKKHVLLVKNTYGETIKIHDIWKEGYSTKGEQRGIGLSNYNEILNKYDCVIRETRVEDSYFVQILKTHACEKGGFK